MSESHLDPTPRPVDDALIDEIARGESERLEFKQSTGQRRQAAHTIAAMLNGRGGRIVFGIAPDGTAPGITIADKTVRDVIDEIREIEPHVFPHIERLVLPTECELLVVTTSTGSDRPYRHRGTPYRRIGSETVPMSPEEADRLVIERRHGADRWELRSSRDIWLAQLDGDEIQRTVEEAIRRGRLADPGTRDPWELLRGLGLVDGNNLRQAAVALFGEGDALLAAYPQLTLRLARFAGTDRSAFVDNRQTTGGIFRLLRDADAFLATHIPVASRIVPTLLERVDEPLYPPIAMREALANAFSHREYGDASGSIALALYDDRMEITSPGGLHFGLTPKDLFEPHDSRPWNPLIARVLFNRGIIERWGSGISRMAEAMQEAGLPPPEFDEIPGALVVRFRQSQYVAPTRVAHRLSERQQAVLDVLGAGDPLMLSQIADRLPTAPPLSTLRDDLVFLRSLGLIVLAGRGRGATWRLSGQAGIERE